MEELGQFEQAREKMLFYQRDPLGAESWLEDFVRVEITDPETGIPQYYYLGDLPDTPHPETGRSYKGMWEWQKENIIRPATSRNEKGFFNYHTICLVLPRGEGKSVIMNLLVLHRFFTQPSQKIILGANSATQTKFVSFSILTNLIQNSPKLMSIIGQDNILDKEIRLMDGNGNRASFIQSSSTSTGIFSNITAFVFSELFDMSNPKYYYQLDSSRRNIPNAQGYIDSTVSSKQHVLYTLYEGSPLRHNKDPGIFFVYRSSPEGHQDDFIHPEMTQRQLESFRNKFTPAEFARYFKNTWDLEDTHVYDSAVIKSMQYVGFQGNYGLHNSVLKACRRIVELEIEQENDLRADNRSLIALLEDSLVKIPYTLQEDGHPIHASASDLDKLSDIYDTNWGVGIGLDLADPLKDDTTLGARTILSCIIKGLPGSRSNPSLHLEHEGVPRYIYFTVHIAHIASNEIADVQFEVDKLLYEYGGINVLCSERWGAAELIAYCKENEITIELISPTYERQRTGFNEKFQLIKSGRFKIPEVVVPGRADDNIIREEMLAFRHDVIKKWYGSETKKNPKGVQDDSMFSLCWGVYGLRGLTPDDFLAGNREVFMGLVINNKDLVGRY